MKEIGRNVRFFGLINGKMILQMYAFTVLFSIMMILLNRGEQEASPYTTVAFTFAMVGPVALFLQAAVGYIHYLSMAIAMGSTRKRALIGMHIAYYLMLGVVFASALIVWLLLPEGRILLQFRCGYAAILFLISFLANIMGLVILKVGAKTGFVVYMISYMVVIALVVSLISIARQMGAQSEFLVSGLNSVWPVAAGLVLVPVSLIGPYLSVHKYEVRG